MKFTTAKVLQIFFISLFVGVGIFAVLGSPVLAAKDSVKKSEEEKLPPYRCVTEKECKENDGYKYIPRSDSRAQKCPENKGRCIVDKEIKLNVPIPGSGIRVKNINDYIDILFKWLLQLGGVIAAAVIVWGGYIYITATGNQAKISQAKETITGGIIGLVLLFGSVTLLGFFNQRIIENAPIPVDKVKQSKYSDEFCTDEDPAPTEISCGKPSKNKDGNLCISNYCGKDKKNVCVRTVLKIGFGFSGEQTGYKCIDKTNKSAVTDACQEAGKVKNFNYCNTLAQYLQVINENKPPVVSCGFGIDNNLPYNTCKFDTRLPTTDKKVVACQKCSLPSSLKTNIGTEKSGIFEGRFKDRFKEIDSDKSKDYVFYCADPSETQTDWINTVENVTHMGVVCVEEEGKFYIYGKSKKVDFENVCSGNNC